MNKLSILIVAALSAVLAPLSAQTGIGEIVGITSATPVVVRQVMSPQARCPQRTCKLSFEKPAGNRAGGSAYDSRLGGLWITNGLSLACVDTTTCKYLCTPVKMPLPFLTIQRPWCTGLAYVDSGALKSTATGTSWLFASYNTGDFALIQVSGCKISARFCRVSGLPSGYVMGGLATDDVQRYLYIGASNNSGGHIILMARIDPTATNAGPFCKPFCSIKVPACSSTSALGPIQGLAHDGCKRMIFVTDGKQTVYGLVSLTASGTCSITRLGCCPLSVNTAGDTYTGLCLQPTPATSHGKSCTQPSCNACSSVMQAALAGDATLGNPAFGLGLRNAPSNTDAAAFAANIGACTNPGVNMGLCAAVRVPLGPLPPIVLLFFGLPSTTGTCGRNLTVPAPLPLTPALCGRPFSFQWVVRCRPTPNSPAGFGITNCLTFSVSGS